MSARALPDRRTVLRGGAALIASMAMLSPRRTPAGADAAPLPVRSDDSPSTRPASRRRLSVGLL